MKNRIFHGLVVLAMGLAVLFSCSNTNVEPIVSEPMRPLADAAGIYLGAACNSAYFSEADYSNTLKTEFNTVVAGNNMKFSYMQPTENGFTYANADPLVTFAEANNMAVRGHVLLWHSDYQVPQWVKDKPFSEMEAVIEAHVEDVMTHFNGKIYAWDVANEIVLDDGSGLRNRGETGGDISVWANSKTDDSVIRAAFVKADEVRTTLGDDVKLFLCDYSNETMGHAKADKFYEIVAEWVNDGVPIDGVAFQMHLMEKYTPDYANIRTNIDRFQALGLEVQFTEVDVRIEEPFTQDKLANQAVIYRNLLQMALDKGIDDFIIWGVTDKYSWIPGTFPGYGSGLVFDEFYNPKLSQVALVNVLSQQ